MLLQLTTIQLIFEAQSVPAQGRLSSQQAGLLHGRRVHLGRKPGSIR